MTFEFPMRADASLLVGVALLIAGCSRPSSSALKPINQAALQTMVDTTAKELLVPGAVLLLRTPQGEFMVTYGTTQLGTTSPPRADTHFRIASNTKSMTAALIVQLAQEGKLSLDDPVSKYVPSVPNGDNITIDELLKMRSGLYNYTDAPELAAIVDRDRTKVWTTGELLAIAFARPANFPPGTPYEYNNTNYTLLLLIAHTVRVTRSAVHAADQRSCLASTQAKDPSMPEAQQYGYGIERLRWGPNAVYFHGGETPGYNAHMGYDPNSKLTFVTWTNLPISVEGKWTSMALVLKIWDQIYAVSPLTAFPSPTASP